MLLEKALAEAYETFKEDAALAMDVLLAEELARARQKWMSESYELFNGRMDNVN